MGIWVGDPETPEELNTNLTFTGTLGDPLPQLQGLSQHPSIAGVTGGWIAESCMALGFRGAEVPRFPWEWEWGRDRQRAMGSLKY